jgi:hypothetical protein
MPPLRTAIYSHFRSNARSHAMAQDVTWVRRLSARVSCSAVRFGAAGSQATTRPPGTFIAAHSEYKPMLVPMSIKRSSGPKMPIEPIESLDLFD